MKIEKARAQDFERVNELATFVQDLHVEWADFIYKKVGSAMQREYFDELVRNGQVFVAREGEEVAGYMVLIVTQSQNPLMKNKKRLLIDSLCVDRNFRGHGIGTKFMQFAENMAREENCDTMNLSANVHNSCAIALYEKSGFEKVSISYAKDLQKEKRK